MANKVLRVDGYAGSARIYKTFSGVDEVYLTLDLLIKTVDFAEGFTGDVGGIGYGSFNGQGNGLLSLYVLDNTAPYTGPNTDWFWDYEPAGFGTGSPAGTDNSNTPAPLANTWQTVQLHYQKATVVDLTVDGVTATPMTGATTDTHQAAAIAVGQSFGGVVVYIDNVKVGTTAGGSDIFSDDFESGSLSAGWTGVILPDAITVVDDPNTPVPPPPPAVGASEVSVAFTSSTLDETPSPWTQLDNPDGIHIVSSYRIDRGRASEFDKTGTGTASIDIFDIDGVVDPTNSSGPFFGNIDPMKQVRIQLRNPVTDVWHYLFKGFASEWTYEVDISGAFTKTVLDCADAFDLLAALEMTPGHHGDTPPANSLGDIYFQQGPPGTIGGVGPSRIHKALDDAGWPAGPREIFPGNVLLQETLYARRDQLLSVIFDAADAEFPGVANVYISKSGYVTFHGRYARFDPTNPDYGIQFWKVGTGPIAAEDATVAPISGLRFRRSKSDIINAAQSIPQIPGNEGTSAGSWTTAELATMLDKDDTSIAKYGWRSDSFDNLLTFKGRTSPDTTSFTVSAVDETKLYSQWRVRNYKNPNTRVEQIVFRPKAPGNFSGPAIWALMTEVEIGDVVTLHTEHPGGGGFDNEDFFVEGIHYDAQPMGKDLPGFPDITMTLDVSPRSLYTFNPFPFSPVQAPAGGAGPLLLGIGPGGPMLGR
jgi:hypothetical protein